MPRQVTQLSIFRQAEINVQHRANLPFLLQTFHSQPFEKFLFPLEIGLQRRHEQAFAKPTGAAEEINLVCIHQFVHQLRLIHIHTIPRTQLLKILYPYRIASATQFHSCYCLNYKYDKDSTYSAKKKARPWLFHHKPSLQTYCTSFAVTLQRRCSSTAKQLQWNCIYVAAALQKRCTGFAVSIWYL